MDTVSPGIVGWRCWDLPHLGIFPSRREHSAVLDCPGTPKILLHLCGVFSGWKVRKGQVSLIYMARVRKCGLTVWQDPKKKVFLKIYQFLSELVSQDQIFPNAATAAELSIHI